MYRFYRRQPYPNWPGSPSPWRGKAEPAEENAPKEAEPAEENAPEKVETAEYKDYEKVELDIESYAYVYTLTSDLVTIPAGGDVPFSDNGSLDGIVHEPNTAQLYIRISGVYQVLYALTNRLAGQSIPSASLAVNGVVDPSTTVSAATSIGTASGRAMLELNMGDSLTLRNSSAGIVILAADPAVGAQLTLWRLDETGQHDT